MSDEMVVKKVKSWTVKDTKIDKYIYFHQGQLRVYKNPINLFSDKNLAEQFINDYKEDQEVVDSYRENENININHFKAVPVLVCILDEGVE